MTVISKELFYEKVDASLKCNEIIHPWCENCFRALPHFCHMFIKGVGQFFLPVYIVKMITDKEKKDPKYFRKILVEYLRTILYGTMFACSLLSGNCLLAKISGRFNYYNVAAISGFVSGAFVFIETVANQKLDALVFVNLVVEALMTNLHFFKIVNLTKTKEIGLFMIVNAFLVYLFKNNETRISPMLWFYIPTNKVKFNENVECNHDKGNQTVKCSDYWFYGFRKYFAVGYVINIIRTLIPTFGKILKKPTFLFKLLQQKSNFKFGLFIGGYVTLLRISSCALFQFRGKNEMYYDPAISGLLSGLSYAIEPRINVLAMAISSMCQLLYFKSDFLWKLNDKLPLRCFLLMICNGILFHNRIYCLETCPKYYINLTNIASNNWAPVLYKNLVEKYILQ